MGGDNDFSASQAAEILPACIYLGRAVNLASLDIDPTDYRTIINKSSIVPIIELDDTNTTDIKPPGSNTAYWLPGNTTYSNLGSESRSHELVTEMGREMADKLTLDASFGVSYSGVTLSSGAQYSYSSSLKSTSVYGVYSFDQQVYGAFLDQTKWYNTVSQGLLDAVEKLPVWSEERLDVYQAYQSFFESWGTHVISRSYLGNRYQLLVTRSEVTDEIKSKFSLHVKTEFAGIVGGGGGGSEDEYKEYLNTRTFSCFVRGGHPAQNGILAKNPTSKEAFEDWQKNRDGAYDATTALQLYSLGTFLIRSTIPAQQAAGQKLSPALDYCCSFASLDGKLAYQVPSPTIDPAVKWGECSLSPLPGLEITAKNNPEWKITINPPSHVRIERSGTGSSQPLIDITVKAPNRPVDVTLNAGLEQTTSDTKVYRYFVLSPYGPKPDQHRTRVFTYRKSGEPSTNTVSPSLKAWGSFGE